jgi:hypothetical protein
LTTLTFMGTDFRGLLDFLIEAVKLVERPSMVVNGKTYAPFELLRVADLLPEDDLLPHHQSIVDAMFTKRQHGYRRTAYNLAHRANAKTICATVGETIQRHMNQKFREQKRSAAVAELIPSELLSKIKRWAKDNNCLPTDAIVRLIDLGLHASKAEKSAPRKAKRPAEGVAVAAPGLLLTSIRSQAAGEGSLDSFLDVNACVEGERRCPPASQEAHTSAVEIQASRE